MSEPPVNLLIIEDNSALADMIREILAGTEQRFHVEARRTLAEGMEKVRAGGIDVIILDLALPDSSGLESLRRLHAVETDLPIVVLTALEDEAVALHSLREGAQDYLIKGEINRSQLVRSIRYAIERRRGEDARLRLAAIVASSRDAIIGMDLEGNIVSWNHGAERIYGYSMEEAMQRSIELLAPPNAAAEISPRLKHVGRGDCVNEFETRAQAKDGRQFHAAISLSPVVGSAGRMIGFAMIARDIDDRKRAEREREELIAHLQSAISHVHTLSGLLPICASCKKIRDDRGYWTQVEEYVKARSSAEFTHGICPDCLEQYKWEITSHI